MKSVLALFPGWSDQGFQGDDRLTKRGKVTQSFPTSAGVRYQLSFDGLTKSYCQNGLSQVGEHHLFIQIVDEKNGNVIPVSFAPLTITNNNKITSQHRTFDFVGSGNSMRLEIMRGKLENSVAYQSLCEAVAVDNVSIFSVDDLDAEKKSGQALQNGSFDSSLFWDRDGNAEIAQGVARFALQQGDRTSRGSLSQVVATEQGKTYTLSFSIEGGAPPYFYDIIDPGKAFLEMDISTWNGSQQLSKKIYSKVMRGEYSFSDSVQAQFTAQSSMTKIVLEGRVIISDARYLLGEANHAFFFAVDDVVMKSQGLQVQDNPIAPSVSATQDSLGQAENVPLGTLTMSDEESALATDDMFEKDHEQVQQDMVNEIIQRGFRKDNEGNFFSRFIRKIKSLFQRPQST